MKRRKNHITTQRLSSSHKNRGSKRKGHVYGVDEKKRKMTTGHVASAGGEDKYRGKRHLRGLPKEKGRKHYLVSRSVKKKEKPVTSKTGDRTGRFGFAKKKGQQAGIKNLGRKRLPALVTLQEGGRGTLGVAEAHYL